MDQDQGAGHLAVVVLASASAAGVFAVQAALASSKAGGSWSSRVCAGDVQYTGPRTGQTNVSYGGTPVNKLTCILTLTGSLSLPTTKTPVFGVAHMAHGAPGSLTGTITTKIFHGKLSVLAPGETWGPAPVCTYALWPLSVSPVVWEFAEGCTAG